ncbi:hypothetical protein bAD24_I09440 [Burkholderia sp. AD24]|nr:hypothetical protein bAD24_I09440 [Burkholderia sp. AD24]
MTQTFQSRNTLDALEALISSPESERYRLKCPQLGYSNGLLTYNNGIQIYTFNLSELYLPATTAHPVVTSIAEFPHYVDTILAAADLRIQRAKKKLPTARTITRQMYLIRNVLDWLRARGIYRLGDARREDTDALLKEFAKSGWVGALSLDERWDHVLANMSPDDIPEAFHLEKRNSKLYIDSLRLSYWNKRLGWGGNVRLTENATSKLEELISSWPTITPLKQRHISIGGPAQKVLQGYLCWFNDLFALPSSVDRLKHLVSSNPTIDSKRLAQSQSTQTKNLSLEDAVLLIEKSLNLLYDVAPLLIAFFEEANTQFRLIPAGSARQAWLIQSKARQRIEEAIGAPISNWTWSGHHPRREVSHSIDEVVASVQGACAIILGAMNARRQVEVVDRNVGLQINNLAVLNDEFGIFKCDFYIAKSYQERHTFYINRASADAIRCLEKLKKLCEPSDDSSHTPSGSIFACGRVTTAGKNKESNFEFAVDHKRTRSLESFLKIAYADGSPTPEIASHMFRRFYAILYFHRYEHAELRALKQHLRHLDVAMTRVYVTDFPTRKVGKQIATAMGRSGFRVVDSRLRDAIDDSAADLDRALLEMSKEKLAMAVDQIVSGVPTSGGFTRIVRKLYRQLQPRIKLESNVNVTPVQQITNLLDAHGYQVKPMLHGQCHAPDEHRHLKAACQHDGVLEREHASADLCKTCPFHFNNLDYLANLEEQREEIDSERHDFLLPPLQQARAEFDFQNLSRIIVLAKAEMVANAKVISELSNYQRAVQP